MNLLAASDPIFTGSAIFWFILGVLFSAWVNIATAKWLHFKELRLRAFLTLIEACDSERLPDFLRSNRAIENQMFPVIVSLRAAKHETPLI